MKFVFTAFLLFFALSARAVEPDGCPVLRGVHAIKGASRVATALHPPGEVVGVVTFKPGWVANAYFVAPTDNVNEAALFVYYPWTKGGKPSYAGTDREDLGPGDVIRVNGTVMPGAFAPSLSVYLFEKVGHVAMPPSQLVRLTDLARGALDNARCRLRGVVMRISREAGVSATGSTLISVRTPDGVFFAHGPFVPDGLAGLVDAEVEIDGVATSLFNTRGEFLGVQMEIVRPDQVTIVVPPPADPFATPCLPLDGALSFGAQEDAHRRHFTGIVTFAAVDGTFFIQDGVHGMRVHVSAPGVPVPGDLVDVAGFPVMDGRFGRVEEAVWRRIRTGQPMPPPMIIGDRILRGYSRDRVIDYEDRFVSLKGRLSHARRLGASDSADVELGLECALGIVNVTVAGGVPERVMNTFAYAPVLEVHGVCELELESGLNADRLPGIRSLSVLVPSSQNLIVIPDAAWKSRARAAFVARSGLVLGVIAFLFGVFFAVFAFRARQAKARADVIALERKRMAGDLHDTIEQHLVGVKLMLETVLDYTSGVPESARGLLSTAMRTLARTKEEVHKAVLDLRSDKLQDETLSDALVEMGRELSASGRVTVNIRLRSLPEGLAVTVKQNTLAIVREAVTNAVRHGHASKILVAARRTGAGGFELAVVNDGERFDPAAVPGAEAGHFGLGGMRERAKRMGGSVTFAFRSGLVFLSLKVPGGAA